MEDKKSTVISQYTMNEIPKIEFTFDPDILTKYKWESIEKSQDHSDKKDGE